MTTPTIAPPVVTPFIPAISSNPHRGEDHVISQGEGVFATSLVLIMIALLIAMAIMVGRDK